MNAYFIRAKGTYREFTNTRQKTINETIMVFTHDLNDENDAIDWVENYFYPRTNGASLDIYSVEIYEKDFTSPKRGVVLTVDYPRLELLDEQTRETIKLDRQEIRRQVRKSWSNI
jgi:hypothetical protein